jgi:hypothetical protein
VHTTLEVWVFPFKISGYWGEAHIKFGKSDIYYIDNRKIYLILLFTSFNHVNNVMDVYTQTQIFFFVWNY